MIFMKTPRSRTMFLVRLASICPSIHNGMAAMPSWTKWKLMRCAMHIGVVSTASSIGLRIPAAHPLIPQPLVTATHRWPTRSASGFLKKGNRANLGRLFYTCGKAEEEDGCDFFQWADEPRPLGAQQLGLPDLVDTNFPRDYTVPGISVVRGAMTWAEDMYHMTVISNEIRAQKKKTKPRTDKVCSRSQDSEIPLGADVGVVRKSAKPMSDVDIKLAMVFRGLGPVKTLRLPDVRDKKKMSGNPMAAGELSLLMWVQICTQAEQLKLGTLGYKREDPKKGDPDSALEDEAKMVAEEADEGEEGGDEEKGADDAPAARRRKGRGRGGRKACVFIKSCWEELPPSAQEEVQDLQIPMSVFVL